MLQVSIFGMFSSYFSFKSSLLVGCVHFGLRKMLLRPLPPDFRLLAPLVVGGPSTMVKSRAIDAVKVKTYRACLGCGAVYNSNERERN